MVSPQKSSKYDGHTRILDLTKHSRVETASSTPESTMSLSIPELPALHRLTGPVKTLSSVAVPTRALRDHHVQGLLHEFKEHGFPFLENTDFNKLSIWDFDTIKRSAECSYDFPMFCR